MPGRRGPVSKICQPSHSPEDDGIHDRIRCGQHSGTGMSRFESEVSMLRGEGRFFTPERPIFIGRSPGRLDLMGGNVDYTGGLVFEATIREATWAAVQLRGDQRI